MADFLAVVSTFSRCEKEILFEKVFRLLFEASCTYLQLHGIFSKPKRSEDGASNWNSLKVLLFKEHISKLCSFWETLKLLLHQKQLVSQVQLKCQTWGIPPLQSSQTWIGQKLGAGLEVLNQGLARATDLLRHLYIYIKIQHYKQICEIITYNNIILHISIIKTRSEFCPLLV